MGTTILGVSVAGWLFFAATTLLFAWGLWMGFRGIMADHPPFREGGHAPGAKGTYDPSYREAAERARRAA